MNSISDHLRSLGIDPEALHSGLLDANGHWLILETNEPLQTNDQNGTSDLYRLDLLSDQLQLISATEQGQAGNGASRHPAADTTGELIVFQSEATDLVLADDNQVSDIFVHDQALGQTTRLSQGELASSNPALDAFGAYLLYDQVTEGGQRQVLGRSLAVGEVAAVLSLAQTPQGETLDNHHPAISADGRFIAYLEQTGLVVDETTVCQVHLYDRDTELYRRQSCPEALATAGNGVRAAFAVAGEALYWYLPGVAEPITLINPLAE